MPSTFRIPKATITGLYGKVLAAVRPADASARSPTTPTSYWHHRQVLKAILGFERKVAEVGRASTRPSSPTPSWPAPARSAAAGAWTSATSWPTTTGWTWPRCARCRAGASPTCSRRSSATSWSTPRR